MFDSYPHTISVSQNYTLYVGVVNNLGKDAYYTVYMKLANQKDSLPKSDSGTPSPLQPMYEYKFFLGDGASWEKPLMFSIVKASTHENESIINQFLINDVVFNINKLATRNPNNSGYNFGLVCELWVYNTTTNNVEFHNRTVSLGLNFLDLE